MLYVVYFIPSAMGYMPNSICYIAICQMLWPLLCLLEWLQNRLDISSYISSIQLWLSILPLQRRNCYYTTRASVYISKSQVFQYAGISWQRAKFQHTGICYILYPGRHILCPSQHIFTSWPAYLKVSGLRYVSLLAHQVTKWYLESQVFQYANISWHEQSFSMPVYHGMSKVSICQHIMAWAKFQYAGISWHEQSFSMPAYHGKSKILVCQHIMASTEIPNHRLFRFASISRHLSITHIAVYFGMPAYHGIL
jgi:hypothetical protein